MSQRIKGRGRHTALTWSKTVRRLDRLFLYSTSMLTFKTELAAGYEKPSFTALSN